MADSPTHKSALILAGRQDRSKELRSLIEAEGWRTIVANSFGPARKLIARGDVSLVVLDPENLRGSSADMRKAFQDASVDVNLILVTGPEGADLDGVRGIEPGAILEYPVDARALRQSLSDLDKRQGVDRQLEVVGRSDAMREVRQIISQIAATPVNVLITGETGTGKSHIAQAIHRNSTRSAAPFRTVNCGAIPETLLESELFGHEKGAFTDARARRRGIFEAADGGTVFLDEIGEMSTSAQVRLLHVLESREITRLGSTEPVSVDVRLIAATNLDLQQAVREGKFRSDLFYRLKVVEIRIPALRQRPEDIPALAERFIQEYSDENGIPPVNLDPGAVDLLKRHQWPGNIRELKNLIERMMVLSPDRRVGPDAMAAMLQDLYGDQPELPASNLPVRLGKSPEESYRDLLYWAVLEVARDVKELKSILLSQGVIDSQSLAPIGYTPVAGEAEVEFSETDGMIDAAVDVESASGNGEIKPLEEVEKEAISRALRATGGHRKRAAKLLRMPERTLYRKIRQFNL